MQIILRSLKKAAPLLARVAFLVSFFWLLFAIIGVQSFKESLSRQCVWLDPLDPTSKEASFTNDENKIRNEFERLDFLKNKFGLKTLSTGMTADYHLAIEKGSTMVRIGSLLFGERV